MNADSAGETVRATYQFARLHIFNMSFYMKNSVRSESRKPHDRH